MEAKPRGEKSVPYIGDFHILSINLPSLLPILPSYHVQSFLKRIVENGAELSYFAQNYLHDLC